MKALVAGCVLAGTAIGEAHAPAHSAMPPAAVTAEQALAALKDGNSRFVVEARQSPRGGILRRCETFTNGQAPIASVLACADSRVPVEMLFDQGIGDLFVARVAGNVADTDEIATIEYGVAHLGTPLVVVLGHARCGAVTAVVDNAPLHGHLELLVDNIRPAVQRVRTDHPTLHGDALLSAAVSQNVWQAVADLLRNSPETAQRVREGKVQVVGAVYDLHSGGVQWLGRHPGEAALLGGVPDATVPAARAEPASAAPAVAHGEPVHAPGAAHSPAAAAPVAAPAHAPADDAAALTPPAHGAEAGEADQLTPATTQPHARQAGHNFLALGVCLAGSATLSGLVIRFLKKPEKGETASEPESAVEAPAFVEAQ